MTTNIPLDGMYLRMPRTVDLYWKNVCQIKHKSIIPEFKMYWASATFRISYEIPEKRVTYQKQCFVPEHSKLFAK